MSIQVCLAARQRSFFVVKCEQPFITLLIISLLVGGCVSTLVTCLINDVQTSAKCMTTCYWIGV